MADAKPVLVFCSKGRERSLMTTAIFMVRHGFAPTLEEAVELIRYARAPAPR
jgi:hypothetical protein